MEIPGTEFLTLDWIIRSIRLTTVTRFMVPWGYNFYLASDFEFAIVQTLASISYCLQIGVRGSVTMINCRLYV